MIPFPDARLTALFGAAMALAASSTTGFATSIEWKPARTVEVIAPAAAGGGPDATARAIQKVSAEKRIVETPMIVVNKPGGNHTVAWNYLNQNPGDGHYLMMVSLGLLTSSLTGANSITYTDATLIAQLFTEYIVFAVRADAPAKSGTEITARVARNPESLTIAAGGDGVGSANHLAAAQAMRAVGADIRRLKVVHFRSSSAAAAAVMGGHVDLIVAPAAAVLAHASAGRLRLLAISAPSRSWGALAEVPTWRELGVNAVFSNVRAVFGPKGLNPQQIHYWETAFSRLAQSREWGEHLQATNRTPAFLNHADSQKAWQLLYEELKTLITELGLARP